VYNQTSSRVYPKFCGSLVLTASGSLVSSLQKPICIVQFMQLGAKALSQILCFFKFGWILPLTVVDNSTISPIRLAVHSNSSYDQEALSFLISSSEHDDGSSCPLVFARVLPPPLTGAALAS
jgi:hypothetical protein